VAFCPDPSWHMDKVINVLNIDITYKDSSEIEAHVVLGAHLVSWPRVVKGD